MKTKLAPKEFRKNGFNYRQIDREGSVAIYAQSSGEKAVAFEVVILKAVEPHPMELNPFDGLVEHIPTDRMWGKLGWTCLTEFEARERFQKLINT